MGIVHKQVIKVKLDFMQLAHLLKGGGMFLHLGGMQVDLAVRKKDLEGKSDLELMSALGEELVRARTSVPDRTYEIPAVAAQGILEANQLPEDTPAP